MRENPESIDTPKHIVFKKQADGIRVIDQMPSPDLNILIQDQEKNSERGITITEFAQTSREEKDEARGYRPILIGVVGHIGHASAKILETLNSHSQIHTDCVIVSATNQMPNRPDLSMAGFAKKISEDLLLELRSIQDDINVFLAKEPKPHHDKYTKNFHQHHNPKFKNKNFKAPIRKTQRKK